MLCYLDLDLPEHYITQFICECYWFCDEFLYDVQKSESKWPRPSAMASFLHEYVSKSSNDLLLSSYAETVGKNGTVMQFATDEHNESGGAAPDDDEMPLINTIFAAPFPTETEQEWLVNNFVQLNVFFRDMVVVEHLQEPAFRLVDFCSNIGGVFGLWQGVSLLTILEIMTFFGRLFYYFCCREHLAG